MLRKIIRQIDNAVKLFLTLLISVYKKVFSPLLGNRCRFYPGCSEYALASLQQHGGFKGFVLLVWRLLRCHPLCAGGYDPVPSPKCPDNKR